MADDCVFCKIGKKVIPSKIQYEDKDVVAFDDINPKAPIHILIVPKVHVSSISVMNEDEAEVIVSMIKAAKKIAKKRGIKSFRLVFNSGKDAGMEIDHLHLHLLGGNKLGSMV